MSDSPALKQIIEGAILAADQPLSIDQMMQLFEGDPPARAEIREVIAEIEAECEGRGFELKQVASGYRFQVRSEYSEWVSRLWEEKPPRYSRAMLETLALIAYKQPITRGDIEEIRGVTVSTNIIRSLMEREWIRVVGHRDVPGRPAIYATTKNFLDYFNLSSLDELPTLSEIKDLDKMNPELDLEEEPPEARTLELDEAEQTEETTFDDVDLKEVSDQVNQIQDNIRNLFAEEEEEDDFDEDDENADETAAADTEEHREAPAQTQTDAETEGEAEAPQAETDTSDNEEASPEENETETETAHVEPDTADDEAVVPEENTETETSQPETDTADDETSSAESTDDETNEDKDEDSPSRNAS